MASKYERTFKPDYVIPQFGVVEDGSLEYLYLHACLHCKLFLILNDLQRNVLFFLVIICLKHFTERSSP